MNCQQICIKHHANGGECSGLVSSNGHSTWGTSLPENRVWKDIVGGNYEGICSPQWDGSQMSCAHYKAIQDICVYCGFNNFVAGESLRNSDQTCAGCGGL